MKSFLFSLATLAVLTTPLIAGDPGVVSITPASQTTNGSANTTYTFVASDTSGASDLEGIDVQFANSNVCWIWYDQPSNQISVYNGQTQTWATATAGNPSGPTLDGEECSVNTASVTTSTSGDNLSVSVNMTLGGAGGPIYMSAMNLAGTSTPYVQLATWTIQNSNNPFFNLSIAPNQLFIATGGSATATVTVTDQPGFSGTVNFLPVSFPNGANLTATFNPPSITGNGTSTMTISSTSEAPPEYFSSAVAASTPDGSQTASAAFNGYVDNAPPNVYMDEPTGSGSSGTLHFYVGDNSKSPDEITGANVLLNSSFNGQNACWIWYDNKTQILWLANDDASSWSGTVVSSPNVVQNSQCAVWGAGSTATGFQGNATQTLSLSIHVFFNPSFTGARTIFARSANFSGFDSGYLPVGTWTVQ